jgi:hypothetical protein
VTDVPTTALLGPLTVTASASGDIATVTLLLAVAPVESVAVTDIVYVPFVL